MTDVLSGKQDVQRILLYAESIAKESRKALTLEFNQKHKGIPLSTAAKTLQDSLVAWFDRRDKNVKVTPISFTTSTGGVRAVFKGEAKNVRFEIHADAIFTVSGESVESPCYLKELNVSIGKA
jgi:predicted amino acid dehydrogenase